LPLSRFLYSSKRLSTAGWFSTKLGLATLTFIKTWGKAWRGCIQLGREVHWETVRGTGGRMCCSVWQCDSDNGFLVGFDKASPTSVPM
jgi:hypothetical protein